MPALETIWRYFPWLSIPVFCLAVPLLILAIVGAIRVVRAAVIVRLPLQPEQTVEFAEPGTVVLALEGPLGSRAFAHLRFTLDDDPGTFRLFRAKTSGFGTARMDYRTYHIVRPGPYTLRAHGLDDPAGRPGHYLVFARPHLLKTLACVLGIVLSAGLTIGSFVLTLLWFAEAGRANVG